MSLRTTSAVMPLTVMRCASVVILVLGEFQNLFSQGVTVPQGRCWTKLQNRLVMLGLISLQRNLCVVASRNSALRRPPYVACHVKSNADPCRESVDMLCC